MRRTFCMTAIALLALLLAVPISAQTAQTAAQNTPQALKATYDQAMKAKDWPAALAAAQQLVDANPTSANLFLLGNAQLYATTGQSGPGPAEASLATYDRALATAEQEKPAAGQPDSAWKDGESRIYIGKGNALLRLKRNPEAIDNYNRSAELVFKPRPCVLQCLCGALQHRRHSEFGGSLPQVRAGRPHACQCLVRSRLGSFCGCRGRRPWQGFDHGRNPQRAPEISRTCPRRPPRRRRKSHARYVCEVIRHPRKPPQCAMPRSSGLSVFFLLTCL